MWSRDRGDQLKFLSKKGSTNQGVRRRGRGRALWEHTWLVKQVRLESGLKLFTRSHARSDGAVCPGITNPWSSWGPHETVYI